MHVHDLLQVLVLPVVEDRVVDDYPVHGGVGVRGQNGVFDVIAADLAEGVIEATICPVSQSPRYTVVTS